MTKQDKLLIYMGEMVSEIASEGYLSVDTMQNYKTFMLGNFSIEEENINLVYIEIINVISISHLSGEGLTTSLDNMIDVFEMSQQREDIEKVLTLIAILQNISYADGIEQIEELKTTTSGLPNLDLIRARLLLSISISNNTVADILEYTTVLRDCSVAMDEQRQFITWESQDV